MENKYFFRRENHSFTFVVKGIHEIKDTDISITNEDYNNLIDLRSKGKQFRLKETPTGEELFDYVEEYTPEIIEVPDPGLEEIALDHEYRISKIELGV